MIIIEYWPTFRLTNTSCDSPLTDFGIAQAGKVKEYFENENITFDEAFSSTSERAMDTLRIITDMPFTSHKQLKEWNFGRLEGEGEHLNPKLPYGDFFVQYNGEGELEFQTRINKAITELTEQSDGENLLFVLHGGILGQFHLLWHEHDKFERKTYEKIPNCAVFKYSYDGEIFTLEDIVAHDFSDLEKRFK